MSALPLFGTEAVSVSVAWTSLLPIVFLAAVACYGWAHVLRRRRSGLEILPETPHRQVPWDGGLTLLSAFLYLGLSQIGTGLLMTLVFKWNDPQLPLPVADEHSVTDPRWMIAMFQAHGVTSYASVCAVAALLVGVARARLDDFGLTLADWRRHLKLGLVGFAVIVPPVVVLQGLLNAVWMESQHPILVAYRASGDSRLLLWCTVAAVFVAPFVEEFFFRGILQGWLERVVAERGASNTLEAAEDEASPADVRPPDTSPMPILFSSTLFALVHIGSGPDIVPIFFLALGLGYLYRQTHSIWPGFVVHTMLNAWSMVALVLMP